MMSISEILKKDGLIISIDETGFKQGCSNQYSWINKGEKLKLPI